MARAPFRRLPFGEIPDLPLRPHPYDATTPREVVIDDEALGRVRVHYREHGDGPPLLLVHGLMTSSYSWRYVLEPLAKRYRLFIPDLPGSGRSDMPVGPYRAPVLARFLGAFMKKTAIWGGDAIGNSLGGYLCMRLALDEPGAFRKLVNVHSPGLPEFRLSALHVATRIPGTRSLVAWLARRDPERWAHRNVHYFDETLKSREEARVYGAPLGTKEGARAFASILADVLHPDDLRAFERTLRERRDAGKGFPVPLLLLYASRDPMVPPVIGDRLHALVPDAGFRRIEDTSHFMHVDSPERVVPLALEFFDAPSPPPRGG